MAWSNSAKEHGVSEWAAQLTWRDGAKIRLYCEPSGDDGWRLTDRAQTASRSSDAAAILEDAQPFLARSGVQVDSVTLALYLTLPGTAPIKSRTETAHTLSAACRLVEAAAYIDSASGIAMLEGENPDKPTAGTV